MGVWGYIGGTGNEERGQSMDTALRTWARN